MADCGDGRGRGRRPGENKIRAAKIGAGGEVEKQREEKERPVLGPRRLATEKGARPAARRGFFAGCSPFTCAVETFSLGATSGAAEAASGGGDFAVCEVRWGRVFFARFAGRAPFALSGAGRSLVEDKKRFARCRRRSVGRSARSLLRHVPLRFFFLVSAF